MQIGDLELAGQPLDQCVQMQRLVRRLQRLPLLLGDRLQRMIELLGLGAGDLVRIVRGHKAISHHEFQNVFQAQAPVRGLGFAGAGRAAAAGRGT